MRRTLFTFAALLSLAWFPEEATAGQQDQPEPIARRASAAGSRIVGVVTDAQGVAIADVTVLAMGATLAMARSETNGSFTLVVPAGDYILRAARPGYVSTYREAVRVQSDLPLRRHITMLEAARHDATAFQPVAASPDTTRATPAGADTDDSRRQSPSEITWRLRHLPRTVLRDRTATPNVETDRPEDWSTGNGLAAAADGVFDALMALDLDGQVDLITTSAFSASGESMPSDWARGVAYVALGAPVGVYGEWSVRTAVAAGDAAWTFAGEYRAEPIGAHAFRAGATYGAQTLEPHTASRARAARPVDVRRAGGIYASDLWNLGSGLNLEYGGRIDRFDYLATPNLTSGRIALLQELGRRTTVFASASRQMIAPGADEFRPPSASGAWLPPERTFSSLDPSRPLAPATVERGAAGVRIALGREAGAAKSHSAGEEASGLLLDVERIRENTANQLAMLFGLDDASQVAHYYVGSPGSVQVVGWRVGVTGQFAPSITGTIDYTLAEAEWSRAPRQFLLRRAARSVVRADTEQTHDLTASIRASVPASSTSVVLAVRVNSGFSRSRALDPGIGGRFALEIRQGLPLRTLQPGALNLVVSARTLVNAIDERGAYYDDLLTVAPPLRLTCGIQMRF